MPVWLQPVSAEERVPGPRRLNTYRTVQMTRQLHSDPAHSITSIRTSPGASWATLYRSIRT